MSLLLFVLIYVVERRNIWRALAVSIGVTLGSYLAVQHAAEVAAAADAVLVS